MVSLIKGMKWQAQMLLIAFLVGGTYLAYSRGWPPFTDANKARIKKLLSGYKGEDTPSETITGPPDSSQFVVDPKVPLGQKEFITAKPDENMRKIFEQEVYKQLVLPFDQYPHLYNNEYLQSTRDRDFTPLTQYGYGAGDVIPYYRPPIKLGAGQSNAPGSSPIDPDLCEAFQQTYGFYPPGGSCDPYDLFNYFDPFFMGQQSGSGSHSIGLLGKANRARVKALKSTHIKDVATNKVPMPIFGHRPSKKRKSGVEVVGYQGQDIIRERRTMI